MKNWRENKVYSIEEKDFIDENYEKHKEVEGLKFSEELKEMIAFESDNEVFKMFSVEKRLIVSLKRSHRSMRIILFLDTECKSLSVEVAGYAFEK